MVDFTNASCFPLEIDSTTIRYERISWTLAASGRQEVSVPNLAKYELHDILAHFVIVMSRIDAQVSTPWSITCHTVLYSRALCLSRCLQHGITSLLKIHLERYSTRSGIPFPCSFIH
jgi:hypothetical protein